MGAYENPRAEPIQFIVSTYPAQNALNVPLDATISVTFGVDLNPATINANTFRVFGDRQGLYSGAYAYDTATRIATFTPNQHLAFGEHVQVVLTERVQAQNGISLAGGHSFTFTVNALFGTGDYLAGTPAATGGTPFALAAGDLDGDGYDDLVVANSASNTITLYVNDQQGGLIDSLTLMTEANPQGVVIGDLDADGDNDILVSNNSGAYLSPFTNNGNMSFTAWLIPSGNGIRGLNLCNVDNDGYLDIVSASVSGNVIEVTPNDGLGGFESRYSVNVGTSPGAVTSSDLNADGLLDIVSANRGSNNISTLLNSSGIIPAGANYATGAAPYDLAAFDIDADGDADIITANGSSNNISILRNDGTGVYSSPVNVLAGTQPIALVAYDADADGDLDVAVANFSSSDVHILTNDGLGNFTSTDTIAVGNGPRDIVALDMSGGFGIMDLAVVNLSDNTLTLLSNQVPEGIFANVSLATPGEQSGDVPVSYAVYDVERGLVSLLAEYSADGGFTWQAASVSGDTSTLAPDAHRGTLTWASATNLPGQDREVTFKITPYRNGIVGTPDSVTFQLDNNHEPVADISPLIGEQSGDVTINYTLEDDEQDTLSFVARYSKDRGKTWQAAAITGTDSGLVPETYAGSLVWHTLQDLPGVEDSLIAFRLIASDYEPGAPGEMILHVDNNDPPSAVFGAPPSDTVVSRITIPYTLSDPENDTLSIVASYSLDGGQGWLPSAVAVEGRAIAPADYSGTVEWLAFANGLAGQHDSVQLRLLPYDYDPGVGDTLTGLTVIYHPGDYTGDLVISTDDLAEFAAAWNAQPQDLAYEIGPATGTVPELLPQPDGLLDFEDLTVFAQMWNWSFAHYGFAKSIPILAKTISVSPTIRLVQRIPEDLYHWDGTILVDMFVDGTENLMMVDGIVSYASDGFRLIEVTDGGYLGQFFEATPLLTQVSPDSSQALFALVGLGIVEPGKVDDVPVATFCFKPKVREPPPLILDYTLTGMDGDPIEAGQVQFEVENLMPKEFALHQNYPNPFNPTTTIRFELPMPTKVYLVIYDILGREVTRLKQEQLGAGYHQVLWNSRDQAGRDLASGIYFARLSIIPPTAGATPEYSKTMKMLLLK